ncbi:methenyltetrahydrofolate synthase domain-containing protein [Leptopilina boulardi]|uniref:methenyltetrahydrofolate synthase domain-containing protein n=1 Tax=Leptopilina boulardi TaxID=63433 RepID=UPI0021F52CEC|nr:methenyltetrahydrofolate synthase domain-containing protein [Leptopilina boulardi]
MEKTSDQKVTMPEEKSPEGEITKRKFRRKAWVNLTKKEAVIFSSNKSHNRIPNFKGAAEAAKRLSELEEFKKAKIIKISPDKPQESVKNLALENDKKVLLPKQRLRNGLFNLVTRVINPTEEELKSIVTKHGIQQIEQPIGLDSDIKVDLVVLGSVCVSTAGHRVGDGEGYADLEFALMSRMGAVNDDTIVVTTVHDCQIVDDLPSELFQAHDLPVDIIVTPTQTIVVSEKLKKPDSVIWNILSNRRLNSMPILQQLKEEEENEGKEVVLKEDDSDEDALYQERTKLKRVIGRVSLKIRRNLLNSTIESGEGDKEDKKRIMRRRSSQKRKGDGDNNASMDTEKSVNKERFRRPYYKSRPRSQIDFSLKLSNISSTVRVRDLKNALSERGVKPNDITWRGQRGFCYLHFGKMRNAKTDEEHQPIQVDSVVANLQQLKIGEVPEESTENVFIVVEPTKSSTKVVEVVEATKPITKIEVTDATSV